ncbi:PepSY-associated TM helix domain-containing protein [Marinifilum fragile]|uniref:PepSY-associated TM helix domain-containing protein n=1 Tax=Marinifilum fragile TaxID=570161 RepID=UPI0006D1FE4B|nr:PepSY-associated TM helix domain-containing protein [Marinifilum fragile]
MIRNFAHIAHSVIGLVTGIVVFIVCITGCLYVFKKEISELSKPAKLDVMKGDKKLALSTLVENYTQQSNASITRIYDYKDPQKPLRFRSRKNGDIYHGSLDPYTGKIITEYKYSSSFWGIVVGLHRHLLLPKPIGKKIIGYSVVLFVISLITGFIRWLPPKLSLLRNADLRKFKFSLKGNPKTFRLHSNLGAYLVLPLLISCLSGLIWSFPNYQQSILYLANLGTKTESKTITIDSTQFNYKSLDGIQDTIQSLNPEKIKLNIYLFPTNSTSALRILSCQDDDQFSYSNNFYAHPNTGDLLMVQYDWQKNRGEKLRSSMYDIHTGSILGLWGKTLLFVISLLAATLPITGYLLYKKRRS